MGPKAESKKKAQKKGRQVVGNPLKSAFSQNETDQKELKIALESSLSNLMPNNSVSTTEAFKELSEDDKKAIFSLPKNERILKIKDLKSQVRVRRNEQSILLPESVKSGIVFGLKKTLLALEKEDISAIIYDSNANFEALKVLFDKGQIPMVGFPNLSQLVKTQVHFPAVCIGIRLKGSSPEAVEHFRPLLKTIEKNCQTGKVTKKEVVQAPLPDVVPVKDQIKVLRKNLKLQSPLITLLRRNSTKERIFHPSPAPSGGQEKDDFKGDFISFKRSNPHPSGNSMLYKKTKMEFAQ